MRTPQSENAARQNEARPFLDLTPNQVVAFNLTRAREWKGWTQDQAAAALEPFLGKRWSKASVSQAERSVAGRVIRNFDADEIVAFARAYDLPITWFFMPPPPWTDQARQPVKLDTPDAPQHGTALAELVDIVFGTQDQQALLAMRLQAWLDQGPTELTGAQQQIVDLVRHRTAALAHHGLGDFAQWQTQLRAIANHLEDLEARSRRAAATDFGLDAS
jgi:hypothetical protein